VISLISVVVLLCVLLAAVIILQMDTNHQNREVLNRLEGLDIQNREVLNRLEGLDILKQSSVQKALHFSRLYEASDHWKNCEDLTCRICNLFATTHQLDREDLLKFKKELKDAQSGVEF
jgi:hypothetical protein